MASFSRRFLTGFFGFLLAFVLVGPVAANEQASDVSDVQEAEAAGWMQKLKAQIIIEDTIEGRPRRLSRIDLWRKKAEDQLAHEVGQARGGFTAMQGSGHQLDMFSGMMKQGVLLGPPSSKESVVPGGRCPKSTPVKTFDITAINAEITLNQWLDFYAGYTYVLTENLEAFRAEEKRNAAAREKENDPGATSNGLQGDMIQPLVIRANQGDCVIITLRNELEYGEPVGLHIHGSSTLIQRTGRPATASNPDSMVEEGETQVYEWYIAPAYQEGALTFHSHGNREQTGLGLVGTFVVEPAGSTYPDPSGGAFLHFY